MRSLAVVLALCSSVAAETYHVDTSRGAIVKHEHRCASSKATKGIADYASKNFNLTVGHDQMTSTVEGHPYGADFELEDRGFAWGWWHVDDDLTMIVSVHQRDEWCRDARRCLMRADVKVFFVQRYGGATCYEEWQGIGEER